MDQPSRFGLNLISQLVGGFIFVGIAADMPPGIQELLTVCGSVLLILFLFGLLYGFFRLFGVRGQALEWFYQHVPFGIASMREEADVPMSPEPTPGKTWNWHALCSFTTLRYIGIALMVTAIAALLFNVEWQLLYKIIATLIGGAVSMGIAEWAKKSGRTLLASVCSLISFALLQLTLTLLYQYSIEQSWPALLQEPTVWLAAKFLLTCLFLFILWRYPSDVQELLMFAIAWASPLPLLMSGAVIGFPIGIVFTALLTAIVLTYGTMHRKPALLLLNVIASFALLYYFYGEALSTSVDRAPAGALMLVASLAFFLVHLSVAGMQAQQQPAPDVLPRISLVVLHVLPAFSIVVTGSVFWLADQYSGLIFVGMGLCSFAASLTMQRSNADPVWKEMLLNLSIIFSGIGLFIQSENAWSAIVLLLVSIGVIWLSLRQGSLRTRIYGFLMLIASVIKLYLQFSELFDSIPGSIAVLLIGVLLVVLSYKFERLKDLLLHGSGTAGT